jgi:hypothetical protein
MTRRLPVFSTVAVLVAAVGCAGAGAPPTETPQPPLQSTAASSDAFDPDAALTLTPVPAPGELFLVGRWRNPGATADTLMRWSNLPFDWRRLLQAREPELSATVALDAPVEVAVAADTRATDRLEQPFAVFSIGLVSLEQARRYVQDKGERLQRSMPGVYRIDDGGDLSCAIAASLGPTPARFVCGDRPQDLDALLPYATRGLPREPLPEADIVVELRAEPLRQVYGPTLRQYRSVALPLLLRNVQLDSPQLERALAHAAYGLADELWALVQDMERLRLELSARSDTAELELRPRAQFRAESSWTVQSLIEMGQRSRTPPAAFWRLPRDASLANFGVGMEPSRSAEIRRTLAELVDGGLLHLKASRRLRNRLVELVNESYAGPGWSVYAEGAVAPDAEPSASGADRERDELRRALGWHVLGLEEKPARVKEYLSRLVGAYTDPELCRLLNAHRVASSKIPRLSARRSPARGLGTGSVQCEFVLPGEAFSAYDEARDQLVPGKPLSVFVVLMPDGESTWLGLSAERDTVIEKLATVRSGDASATLAGQAGLSSLRSERVVRGGYMTLAGLATSDLIQQAAELGDPVASLMAGVPNRGQTPITWTSWVSREGGTHVDARVRVPKAVLQDLLAAALSAGLDLR